MSLRFPRPVIVTAAIGVAAAWTAVGSVPALADQVRQNEWWLGELHVTQAQHATQGAGVTIALLDTGVDPVQQDIAGSVISGPDFTGSGEKPGSQFYGIHGTAMASLIVGHGHGPGNADGVLGVAPAAKLLSVRVVLDSGDPLVANSAIMAGLPNAIAEGIRYAVNNGAQVIDLPLDPGQSPSSLVASTAPAPPAGTPPTPTQTAQQAAAGGSAAEQSAVAYALGKGVVLVAPGGDNATDGDDADLPADYPGVISVGAFNSSFIKAAFSSRQPYVTLTAAGSGMTAATPTGYTTVSSTSAASAVVTGIAALIKAQYPELTPAQVTQALTTSTVFRPPNGMADGSGHGTADAARALAAAQGIAGSVHRANAGSVSRANPAAPAVPFIDQALAPKIKRDGLISAGVLVVLLVPVIAFALIRRRRRKTSQAGRPEQEQIVRRPYAAQSGETQADQMLAYFAAVPAQADGPPGARSPVGSAEPAAARGAGYARGAGAHGGTFADAAVQADDSQRGGQFPRSPLGAARRAAARPPKVSGTPPWEPAPKPESELPWASSPPALPRRAPIPMPAPPATAAAEAGGATGGAAATGGADGSGGSIWGQAGRPRVAAPEPSPADGESGSPSGIRPIYVWDPGGNTDAFPSVPSTPDKSESPSVPSAWQTDAWQAGAWQGGAWHGDPDSGSAEQSPSDD